MGCVRESVVLEKGMLGLNEKTWVHPQLTVTDRSLEQPLLLSVPWGMPEEGSAVAVADEGGTLALLPCSPSESQVT